MKGCPCWPWATTVPRLGDKGLPVTELISFHRQSGAFCSICQVRVTKTDGQGSRKLKILVPAGTSILLPQPARLSQTEKNHEAPQGLSGPHSVWACWLSSQTPSGPGRADPQVAQEQDHSELARGELQLLDITGKLSLLVGYELKLGVAAMTHFF